MQPRDSTGAAMAGDDLIGPKDIKRGLHLLTNANMAALDEPAEEAEDSAADGADADVERQDGAATAREAHAQELLSDDQINQVGRGDMQFPA